MLQFLLYNLVLGIAVILLSPIWLLWLLLTPKIRAGFWQKLGLWPNSLTTQLQSSPSSSPRIWIHAVSVGELNAARSLIQQLEQEGYFIVISTTTKTGNELAKTIFSQLPVIYFPFDFLWSITKAIRLVRPDLIVLMETEIWPNFLGCASLLKIPVVMANGRLSEKSFRGYLRFKWFFSEILQNYTRLLMQSQADAERITALGAPNSQVRAIGNIKFDLPAYAANSTQEKLKQLFQFPEDAPVLIIASTHKGEDELFIEVIKSLQGDFPELRVILAPRHPERAQSVSSLLTQQGLAHQLRSQLNENTLNPHHNKIVVLDTIGELNASFGLGNIACMGGSFIPMGGHNPLEPINAGIPVVFGPHMHNFKDIAQKVLQAKAGIQVQSHQEATQAIRQLLLQQYDAKHLVEQGKKLMTENQGVTQIIAQEIQTLLSTEK
jgi:3-deoxy-D-manno-octulosonic-acid transferase